MYQKVLEKAFSIYEPEFGRVLYAWSLKFLHKFGLVMGWTTVIALFVAKYSISSLPFLFMVQAALTISGTIIYSFVADRFESRKIISLTGLAAAIILLAAGLFFGQDKVFFPLVLLANGFFLQQISVFLSSYIEDFFTPVEASRVFPVIESADTVAGVCAGLVLAGALASGGGRNIFFFWVIAVMTLMMVLYFLSPRSSKFLGSLYEMKLLPKVKRMDWRGLRKSLSNISKIPFLQVMASIFFIQWFVAQLIEFQFTKVVDEGVLNGTQTTTHAEGLVHGLGMLNILFFGCALFVQLLLAGRILRFLGTVGGLFFHAIMTLMSALSMMIGLGYFTTVMTRNNFEVSGVISKNAYEASYYAFPHGTQKNLREFFEGILAPLATIAGTIFLLLTGMFFVEKDAILAINVLLVLVAALMVVLSFFLQNSYTGLVKRNLAREDSRIAKFHAIDILEEKGHLHGAEALGSALIHEKDPQVQVRILSSLGRIGSSDSIPSIEKMLESGSDVVRIKAAEVIGDMRFLRSMRKEVSFTRHRLAEKIRKLELQAVDSEYKMALIRSLCLLEEHNAGELLKMLNHRDSVIQIECIGIMASYRDKSMIEYLRPMLNNGDIFVRAKAVAAILGLDPVERRARHEMEEMLKSADETHRQAVMAECWKIRSASILRLMTKELVSRNPLTRLYAAIGLVKSGRSGAAAVLADLLLFQNNLFFGRAKSALKGMDNGMRKIIAVEIEKAMMRRSGLAWNDSWNVAEGLELMGVKMLSRMREAYALIGLEDEIELIDAMIEYRDSCENTAKNRPILFTENVTN